jgi:hypothetical protein
MLHCTCTTVTNLLLLLLCTTLVHSTPHLCICNTTDFDTNVYRYYHCVLLFVLSRMGRTHEAQSLRHDILKSVGYSQADIDAAENADDADETAESVIAADSETAEQQQATAAQTA